MTNNTELPTPPMAPIWRRFCAIICDTTLLAIPLLVMEMFISITINEKVSNFLTHWNYEKILYSGYFLSVSEVALIALATGLTYTLYEALMFRSRWQATIGKRLFKVYVADTLHRRIHFPRAFFRSGSLGLLTVTLLVLLSYGETYLYNKLDKHYEESISSMLPCSTNLLEESKVTYSQRMLLEDDIQNRYSGIYDEEYESLSTDAQWAVWLFAEYESVIDNFVLALWCTSALVGLVWYLPAFCSPERTATHDILCRTRVYLGRK